MSSRGRPRKRNVTGTTEAKRRQDLLRRSHLKGLFCRQLPTAQHRVLLLKDSLVLRVG